MTCPGVTPATPGPSWSARSCCSRPRSAGRCRAGVPSCSAGPHPTHWPLLHWSTSCAPGRDSATHGARDLQRSAALISAAGWPRDERALRALPGVGEYTARALLVFAFAAPAPLPRDVNIARVTARAALGVEPEETRPSGLDAALASARPPRMSRRRFVFALFDAGALHCRARPLCAGCP